MNRFRLGLIFLGVGVLLHGLLSPLALSRPIAWLVALTGLVVIARQAGWETSAGRGMLVLALLILPLAIASITDVLDPQTNIYVGGVPVGEYPGGELWWTGLFAVPLAILTTLSIHRKEISKLALVAGGLAGAGLAITFLYEPLGWARAGGMDAQIYAFLLLSLAHLLVLGDLWTAWQEASTGHTGAQGSVALGSEA